jgi:hypothetical protein
MKRRSKYSTGGAGRDSDKKRTGEQAAHQSEIPSPYAGKPLDGSQFLDVIEEQKYAEQRPTPEEQRPRRGSRDTSG